MSSGLRATFFLLVLGNLIFFAWAQGYFGAGESGREPQRLAQQLYPEKLRIALAEKPSTPTKDDALACKTIGGLLIAEMEILKAAAQTGGWEVKVSSVAEAPAQLVLISDLPTKVAADKKAGELRLLGVENFRVVELSDGRHEIILGKFSTVAAAQELLQLLAKKNVKSARLESREIAPVKAIAEVRAPAETLTARLPELIAPYAGAVLGNCSN